MMKGTGCTHPTRCSRTLRLLRGCWLIVFLEWLSFSSSLSSALPIADDLAALPEWPGEQIAYRVALETTVKAKLARLSSEVGTGPEFFEAVQFLQQAGPMGDRD